MENIKVYLLNIDEVNAYVDKNYFREEFRRGEFIESVENLTEEDCRKIIDASRDRFSDCYSLKGFEAEFNYDIDSLLNSDRYFVRFF